MSNQFFEIGVKDSPAPTSPHIPKGPGLVLHSTGGGLYQSDGVDEKRILTVDDLAFAKSGILFAQPNRQTFNTTTAATTYITDTILADTLQLGDRLRYRVIGSYNTNPGNNARRPLHFITFGGATITTPTNNSTVADNDNPVFFVIDVDITMNQDGTQSLYLDYRYRQVDAVNTRMRENFSQVQTTEDLTQDIGFTASVSVNTSNLDVTIDDASLFLESAWNRDLRNL